MLESKIWDVCTRHEVAAGAPNRTLQSAFLIMSTKGFRRLPITKIGKIFGILTVTDLLKAINDLGLPEAYKAKITDYMVENPITIHQEKTVADAIRLMSEKNFGSLIVTGNKEDRITGIVTERDIVRLAGKYVGEDAVIDDARDLVEKEYHVLDITTPIDKAISSLIEHKTHRAVSLREGQPFGVLTASDIINLVAKERDEIMANPNFLTSANIGFLTKSPLHSAKTSSKMISAIEDMVKNKYGGLPIFDDDDKLIGMFSERTIVRYLSRNI